MALKKWVIEKIKELKLKWNNDDYYFDEDEAEKIWRFIGKLKNDKGITSRFEIIGFQFEIITEILCVKDRENHRRKHREVHINMARKNGKSFIIAIIITYLFFCQPKIRGAIFILTANDVKQAGELFDTVCYFIKTNRTLKKYCRFVESKRLVIRKDNRNKLMVLSSDATGADSYSDYVACLDEIHESKNDRMYGKLGTGQGAWDDPLLITITTASSGEDETNLEQQLYSRCKKIELENDDDPTFYYRIYEADKGCDLEDQKQWEKANPGIDIFRSRKDIEVMARKAKQMPLQENMFRRMFLNQHVVLDGEKGAINMDLWDLCTKDISYDALKGLPCWNGLDLSSSRDITAFVQVFYDELMDKFIIWPHLFTPKDTVIKREEEDKNPYSKWIKDGELIALAGKYINFELLLDYVYTLAEDFEFQESGFDRWGSPTILNRLEEKWDIVPMGQGMQTMTPIINDFECLLIDERIIIAENDCFRTMAKNCVAVFDDAMNVKYSKRKSRFKIDGIIGMLMGLCLAIDANKISHYDMVGALEQLERM
ncbi:terminase large subunit [Acetobacterium malicum]|uniref:Terminase large subunit n=1 Tax=Acetobacterium malicum TaxID=52692 RepID=A0ABR6Z1E0_9FIRM|nr:terminase TerL endonuclease subunit [Acetobacterium malicum]MBC3901299.1 terminase large subunit [Acetobacterium malicum]